MLEKFKLNMQFFSDTFRQKSLRRNVLVLALSGVALTFVFILITAPLLLYFIEGQITERGKQWGEQTAYFAEKLYREQTEEHLRDRVVIRADLINKKLEEISTYVEYIAADMEAILKNKSQYRPRYLPNPAREAVPIGKAYAYFRNNDSGNVSPEALNELYLESNIGDFIISQTEKYYTDTTAGIMVVSEDNFVIGVDYDPKKNFVVMPTNYTDNPDFQNKFSWYNATKETDYGIFTKPQLIDGNYSMYGAFPYHDADGNFAGAVAIGAEVNTFYRFLVDPDSNENIRAVIVNQDGQIIMSSETEGIFVADDDDMRLYEDSDLADVFKRMTEMESDVVSLDLNGKAFKGKYYIAFAPIKIANWSFGRIIDYTSVNVAADTAKDRILGQMNTFKEDIERLFLILVPISMAMIVVMLVFVLRSGVRESDKFLNPIQQLIDSVQDIAKGNFDRRLEVPSENEIGKLAQAVNTMADELKTYMINLQQETAERERISTELNVATNIQQSMLPHEFDFDRTEFEIFASMEAAKEVGGDFYDFYFVDNKHLIITMADVSGKGVPAALFMSRSKTMLQNFAFSMKNPDDLAAVMTLSNRQLCYNNEEMLFVTVFMGMLNLETGEFIYANGGHNAPLVLHENKFEFMDVGKSCMLGIDEDVSFEQQKIVLAPGDIIFLYTDGVTEAMNEGGELFGENYLRDVLNGEDTSESLETLLEHLRQAIKNHAGNAEQSDDITMLALKFNGGGN